MKSLCCALLPVLLAGCATTAAVEDAATAESGQDASHATCNAIAAQYHIGHDATQAMGAAILADSGASSLRWGPPGAAWTMDYRVDRVNVRYDDEMKITAITCG